MSSNTWRDISSSQTKVAILLEQLGGYCELRLNINRPKLGRPYDAGHTVIVPPDMPIWGYSDNSKITKDLRLSFDTDVPAAILGGRFGFFQSEYPYHDAARRARNLRYRSGE